MSASATVAVHEPDEVLLGFARALRGAGVPVTLDRSRTWLEAAALVDLGDRQATYWAGRASRNRSSNSDFSASAGSSSPVRLAASSVRRCRIWRGKSQS